MMVDFKAGTLRIDESSDHCNKGKVGPCKNVAAYRTIGMFDREGRQALRVLKKFLRKYPQPALAHNFIDEENPAALDITQSSHVNRSRIDNSPTL
jgi:hypothetical protein